MYCIVREAASCGESTIGSGPTARLANQVDIVIARVCESDGRVIGHKESFIAWEKGTEKIAAADAVARSMRREDNWVAHVP